ncbi:MAG: nucleotide exchange factor GrpE [Candidatus Paceibacterota bacterium]|jgi:molecular chaperone GrpE|nr:nucleotide exchange factor GrpE [Candidatus Paceibacterota bacterium]MDD4830751.1 nucleotide exchange factor GrpE [Candidatus Paceibacterota bacterium]MDD4874849.1 nucleotide exchange factor GrpE [Candidatus Paceibacterota bacterium]
MAEEKNKKEEINFQQEGENIEELKKELEESQKQKEEYLAGWQRARADFLNYKKEEAGNFSDMLRYSTENFVSGLLPILDSFNMAEKILSAEAKKDNNMQGMLQIKSQFLEFLKKQDVEEIKSLEEKFDPNFHEVVEEVEETDKEPGTVIEELQKGYTLQGRVIRPARVRIAK